MKTIYKYELAISDGPQVRAIPAMGEVKHVALQGNKICLWCEVTPGNPTVDRHFQVYGTGHEIEDDYAFYRGSIQQGPYVWHVFEVQP